VVEGVQAVERATGRLVLPFVVITLAGTVITGCWMHGFSTVYLIFGPEDAENLMGINRNMGVDSNWGLALPFIPLALVASRGSWGDSIFPILPLFYFASNSPQRDGHLWPPSVAMTMAIMPYIRAAYNEFYARILAPKEKAWTKEIQPRAEESGENDGQEQNDGGVEVEVPGGLDFELDVQVEIVEEQEVPEGGQQQREQQREQPRDIPPAAGQVRADPDRIRERAEQEFRERRNHGHIHPQPVQDGAAGLPGGALLLRPKQSAQSVIGALMFPTVAAAMGVLLKAVLPKSWINPPRYWDRYTPGFLSSRFGRSIAGGFLFIVLRDTVSLYSKYRLAQSHKQRRIVDYQGKSKSKKAEMGSS